MSINANLDNAITRPDLGILFEELVDGSMANGFVANEVLPIVKTDEEAATYDVLSVEAMMSVEDDAVALDGAYARNSGRYETGKYTTQDRGLEEGLHDDQRKRLEKRHPGSAEKFVLKRLTQRVIRSREKRVADKVFDANVFTPHPVSTEWSNAASTPIADVKAAQLAVYNASGVVPDTLILNYNVFRNLQGVTEIKSDLKYVYGVSGAQDILNLNQLSSNEIAKVLGVNKLVVAGALYNSAAGGQDATLAKLWSSEYAMLTKLHTPGSDVLESSLGVTFVWTDSSAIDDEPLVEQYREEAVRTDIYRARWYIGEEFIQTKTKTDTIKSNIAVNVSYLLSNITA